MLIMTQKEKIEAHHVKNTQFEPKTFYKNIKM